MGLPRGNLGVGILWAAWIAIVLYDIRIFGECGLGFELRFAACSLRCLACAPI